MQVHFVHWKSSEFSDISQAAEAEGGLAVMAVLLQVRQFILLTIKTLKYLCIKHGEQRFFLQFLNHHIYMS